MVCIVSIKYKREKYTKHLKKSIYVKVKVISMEGKEK